MKNSILFIFLFLFSLAIKGQNYVSNITSYEIYKSLKGKPLSDKFSNIESVKIVYDIRSNKLYYFNSTLISHHYQFATDYLVHLDEIIGQCERITPETLKLTYGLTSKFTNWVSYWVSRIAEIIVTYIPHKRFRKFY